MNWMQRVMYGRHGIDQLSSFLLALYFVFYLFARITGFDLFSTLGFVLFALSAFRIFSRNSAKRRAENDKFMGLVGPALRWLRCRRNVMKDKEHRYFKCPNCRQQLRAPRGKGKIQVTCRSCGVTFEEIT